MPIFSGFITPSCRRAARFSSHRGAQRVVYTYSSPRLEEDLRHEATHALLRGSFGDLPLWLDEGLAEYFETDLAQPGAEHERIDHIADDLTGGWSPSLPRLESLSDIRQMTPRDYREAWAWVHLFLNGSSSEKTILLTSLSESNEAPNKLRLEEKGANNERLLAHIKALQSRSLAVEASAGGQAIRLARQDGRSAGRTSRRSAGSGGGCGRGSGSKRPRCSRRKRVVFFFDENVFPPEMFRTRRRNHLTRRHPVVDRTTLTGCGRRVIRRCLISLFLVHHTGAG